MLTEPQTRADGLLGHAAPVDFMVRCKQVPLPCKHSVVWALVQACRKVAGWGSWVVWLQLLWNLQFGGVRAWRRRVAHWCCFCS